MSPGVRPNKTNKRTNKNISLTTLDFLLERSVKWNTPAVKELLFLSLSTMVFFFFRGMSGYSKYSTLCFEEVSYDCLVWVFACRS